MRVQRHAHGSVRFDRRRRTWNFLWYEAGKRRSKLIGTKRDYPTKAAAWKAVDRLEVGQPKVQNGQTVRSVIARYETERMPSRHSTARVYRSFLNNHILPEWGDTPIQAVQPRPVELWLRELSLSPKSKTHVRSLMHGIVEFAMWAGLLDISRNPISLVQNNGATRRSTRRRAPCQRGSSERWVQQLPTVEEDQMSSKPLDHKDLGRLQGATVLGPGDFPIGSPESRAAARLRLQGAGETGRGSPSCICFPSDEQPFFCWSIEEDIAAAVKCPLHGERFNRPIFHLYVSKWLREKQSMLQQRKSPQYQKAWAASFPSDLWPAEEVETDKEVALRLKDGTLLTVWIKPWPLRRVTATGLDSLGDAND